MIHKLILKLSIIFIGFLSCNSQQSKIKKMPLTEQEILELATQIKAQDTVFMKKGRLDIQKLEKIGTPSGIVEPKRYNYIGIINQQINLKLTGNVESGYFKYVKLVDDLFEMYYEYYPSGILKQSCELYSNEFAKGIRYWFDESGNVEKYEDCDAPYDFGWEDVKSFIEKEKIDMKSIIGIRRSYYEGNYEWAISYIPSELEDTDSAKYIHLDGKTGQVTGTGVFSTARYLH